MDSQVVFTERQRFSQWWLWLILLGMNGLFIFGSFQQLVAGKQFGDRPMSNNGLLLMTFLTILISLLFYCFRLETYIKKDGIYVRFFPFQLKFKYYNWSNIKKSYVRRYKPILEYGGWGWRMSISGKGKALSVSGNHGLQLELLDDKKLLIGTKSPEELTKALNSVQHNHIS
ncbi:DUF6141 family protein [Pedobacter immunditicola]|uniref:DUF6141 family protein n=1 Tax=Pedobacter immunditicola TaxID=3133440 RepID=UPI0030977622